MNRNRTAGHNWEREIVKLLKSIGFLNVVTSRSESKSRDDMKVDFCFTDPFNIQAKLSNRRINYIEILNEMPNEDGKINIIFDRQTKKKGERFYKIDDYVHLKLKDFLTLINKIDE